MKYHKPNPSVALVYPPFGPPHLASLGLAAISAGIKRRDFRCRTFYWCYRFAQQLPGVPPKFRQHIYHLFTQRALSPWNEWVFTRHALGDRMASKDADVVKGLEQLDQTTSPLTTPLIPSELVLGMCNGMGPIIESFVDELESFDIVGVGTTFFQNGAALALCKRIKERWPEKITVLGGANCDGEMGEALIECFDFVDCVFSGEVDHEVGEFVHRLDAGEPLEGVRGLLYRDESGQLRREPPAIPIQDMNSLPYPDFDDWLEERKRYGLNDKDSSVLPLESSRGCWWGAKHHCTFCGLNANGMAYRQKDVERFQKEVLAISKRYKNRFFFMADNILSTKYYSTFIAWAKDQNLGLDFFFEIKANMNRKQVADLAAAGVTMVQPGIEHFSSSILALMNKGTRGINNVAFLKYAAESGVATIYSILAGFPGEDPNEYGRLAKMLPMLHHLRPPSAVIDIEFHRFSPYHNEPKVHGIRLKPHSKYAMIFPVPEDKLAKLAYQFEVYGRRSEDLTYLNGCTRAVNEWQREFMPYDCLLTWHVENDEIRVRDRRSVFGPREYRLRGYAPRAFLSFEQPRTLRRAIGEARQAGQEPLPHVLLRVEAEAIDPINDVVPYPGRSPLPQSREGNGHGRPLPQHIVSFTEEEFCRDPERCLVPLVQGGVLFEEDGSYLNLPIRADYKCLPDQWGTVNVP